MQIHLVLRNNYKNKIIILKEILTERNIERNIEIIAERKLILKDLLYVGSLPFEELLQKQN